MCFVSPGGFYSPVTCTVREWKQEGRPTFPWRAVRHTWVHSTRQSLHTNQLPGSLCSVEPLLMSFFRDWFA